MDVVYNLEYLRVDFKKSLLAENISSRSIRNYLSDVGHYIGWLSNYLHKIDSYDLFLSNGELLLNKALAKTNSSHVALYINDLYSAGNSSNTINRRISTLTKLYSYAFHKSWLVSNISDSIQKLRIHHIPSQLNSIELKHIGIQWSTDLHVSQNSRDLVQAQIDDLLHIQLSSSSVKKRDILNSTLYSIYIKYLLNQGFDIEQINKMVDGMVCFYKWCENHNYISVSEQNNIIKKIQSSIHTYNTITTDELSQESKDLLSKKYQLQPSNANTSISSFLQDEDIDSIKNIDQNDHLTSFSPSSVDSSNIENFKRDKLGLLNHFLIKFNQNLTHKNHSDRAISNSNTFAIDITSVPTLFITLGVIVVFIFIVQTLKSQTFKSRFLSELQNSNIYSNSPKRTLTFQGRLYDHLGNPIDSKTDISFRIYDNPNSGKPLYVGNCFGTNALTPDIKGNFKIELGKNCKMPPLPESIFTNQHSIYIGITVASDVEMSPRTQIPNVGLSSSAMSIQGYKLGSNVNEIPYIDNEGKLQILAESPSIESTSGEFRISGQSLRLETPNNSQGNILFAPDVGGNTIVESGNFGIGTALPSAELDVSGNASISGELTFRGIFTRINQLNGGNMEFSTSTGGMDRLISRLTISNNGMVGIGTNSPTDQLTVKGNISPTSSSIYNIGAINKRWNSVFADNIVASASGVQGYIQRINGVLSPSINSDDLIIGSMATSSATIRLSANKNDISWLNGAQIGIGTIQPIGKFHVSGSVSGKALTILDENGGQDILTASASGSTKFVIANNGNIGINTATPTKALDVNGAIRFNATGDPTTNGLCHSGDDSNTTFSGREIVACSSAPGDIAEWYETKDANPGDIVMMTDETITFDSPKSDALTGRILPIKEKITTSILARANNTYNSRIAGVVSTSPYQTIGKSIVDVAKKPQPIALIGRVPVKVTGINGIISPGDPITTSSIAGAGMKATRPGMIVGRSLEKYIETDPNKIGIIYMLVNITWYEPSIVFSSNGDPINTDANISYGGVLDQNDTNVERVISNTNIGNNPPINDIASTVSIRGIAQLVIDDIKNMEVGMQEVKISGGIQADTIRANTVKFVSGVFDSISTKTLSAVDAQLEKLIVSDSIKTPVLSTDDLTVTHQADINKISTSQIRSKNSDLTIQLGDSSEKTGQVPGKLGELIIQGLENKRVAGIDALGNATFSGTLKSETLIANTASISGTMTANTVSADLIQTQDASVSGSLIANEISAKRIHSPEINDIKSSITNSNQFIDRMNQDVNTIQTELANISKNNKSISTTSQSLSSSQIDMIQTIKLESQHISTDDISISGTLNVTTAYVADHLTVGEVRIQDSSILSLADELSISSLSKITFFNGLVKIEKDGSLTTEGLIVANKGMQTTSLSPIANSNKLEVDLSSDNTKPEEKTLSIKNNTREVASISSNGNASFEKLNLDSYDASPSSVIIASSDNFKQNGIMAPAIETSSHSVGAGLIPENSSEVVIFNTSINENSLIYLTPVDQVPNGQLTVAAKQSCKNYTGDICKKYFKVITTTEQHPDIKFNWLIIN
ncbi:MAG: site-specific integrase [Candidatus Roizmanbacteria bacterium]